MLPAVWAGFKGLDLGIKVAVVAVIVLVPVLIYKAGYWAGKSDGKQQVRAEWDAALVQQAKDSARQVIEAQTMASSVVNESAQEQRVIEAKAEQVKKEVVHHAKQNPTALSAATVAIYDRLISVPNETGHRLPAADPGPGTPEVPRGGLAAQTLTALQDEDGQPIELTTEELAQAAVDFAEKYALMKNAYKSFSDWNDGREAIELKRLQGENP